MCSGDSPLGIPTYQWIKGDIHVAVCVALIEQGWAGAKLQYQAQTHGKSGPESGTTVNQPHVPADW